MKKEFEKHCDEYNLVFNFKELSDSYADSKTHQAYQLFKSLTKNTIHNSNYAKCADDIMKLDLLDAVINKKGVLVDILRAHFA